MIKMKPPQSRRKHWKKTGFTLLEMLASITIVIILIVLIFFGVKMGVDATDSVKCVGNLRAIGVGFASHAADNGGVFPNYGAMGDYWPGVLAKYGVPRKAFFCPVALRVEKPGDPWFAKCVDNLEIDSYWNSGIQTRVSYGYNSRTLAADHGSTWSPPSPNGPVTINRLAKPGQTLLVADGGRINSDKSFGWGFWVIEPQWMEYSAPLPRHRRSLRETWIGEANVLWVDGSVSSRKVNLRDGDWGNPAAALKYITQENWTGR